MKKALFSFFVVLAIVAGWFWWRGRTQWVVAWLRNPSARPEWEIAAKTRCGAAPFLFPTDGMVGYLWGDSFRPGHLHQGIDIFAGTAPGETPVYAVADGYLTRLPDWKSALILRIPSDPLAPGRQIWVYYSHMADAEGHSFIVPEFPPGTYERFVPAGTLLGYQGNYSGNRLRPTGVHLHLSLVRSGSDGVFLNETHIANTYDPSPYFGMALNAVTAPNAVPVCQEK